ncbi:hypothetical protein KUTeg_008747 [Tegillarca granosa]|uniref:CUB domain-containing protein n=1 Tax=Tegillarca granosa TaxID=220873 RepID=A0ABQ9FD82_TEGGR|nr:hypothetical protein KUTeg_008747 [Tegillarca granosa]
MTKQHWTLFFICVLLHINKVKCQCGSTQSLSASYASAVIQSPGYDTGYSQNLACTWSISTSLSGASIIFQIRDIWISCSGDKVVTYDGTSDTAAVIDDLCSSSGGGAKGNIRVPSSGDVFLKFTTNNNVDAATEKGFQFFYTAAKDFSGSGCPGPQSLTAASTDSYISSPGFPSKYSLSQTCSWVITAADSSEHVYIEFIFIDIENDGTCQYDYLRIQDGTIDTKICVTEWNYGTTYTSTGTSFTLTFYSDDAQDAQGFLLKYRQTQTLDSSLSTQTTTLASTTTTLASTTTTDIKTSREDTFSEQTVSSTTDAADTTTKTPETTTVAEDVTASSESDTKVTSTVTVTTAENTYSNSRNNNRGCHNN